MEQDPVQYWLETCKNPKTKQLYQQRFKSFETRVGKTGKVLLELRREQLKSEDITQRQWMEKQVVDFYEELCGRMASHTAWSYVTAVRSFFATFGKEMQLTIAPFMKRAGTSTPLAEKQKHPFTQDELRKMYHVANLKEKLVLLFGVQTGISAGELVSLKIEDIDGWLDKEPPIGPMEIVRKKEDTKIFLMLGRDLVETLKQFIESLKNENPPQYSGYLFCTHISGKRQEEHWKSTNEPDRIIKQLARRANIKPLGNTTIRYHGLRAYFDDTCKSCGIAQDHIDMMVGHKVRYNQAYTLPTNLRELYSKAEARLTLSTAPANQNHELIVELGKQLSGAMQKIEYLSSQIEQERIKRTEIESKFERLEKYVTDVVPRYAPELEYRDEVIDRIITDLNLHPDEVKEVFYDVLYRGKHTVIEIRGYLDKQGKFNEYISRIIRPEML